MRICPKCQNQVENDKAKFCRKCGASLSTLSAPEQRPDITTDDGLSIGVNPAQSPSYDGGIPLTFAAKGEGDLTNESQGVKEVGEQMPRTYLVWAILSVLCCAPTGICAIVCAHDVGKKYKAGDYPGAVKSSAEAKKWTIVSVVLALVTLIVMFII